jgi:hypothetical protein
MSKIIEDVILNHDVMTDDNRMEENKNQIPRTHDRTEEGFNAVSADIEQVQVMDEDNNIFGTNKKEIKANLDIYSDCIVLRHSLVNPNPESTFNPNYPAQTEVNNLYTQKFKTEQLFDDGAKRLENAHSNYNSGDFISSLSNSQMTYRNNLVILELSIESYKQANKKNPSLDLTFFKLESDLKLFKAKISASIAQAQATKQGKVKAKKMTKLEIKREQDRMTMLTSRKDIRI